jgi:xanthine dehydrogenase YagR molybdenum-binding subunit
MIAAAVATDLETARHAAELISIEYDGATHDVTLRADHPEQYRPDRVNPDFPTDTHLGDFDAAFASAPIRIDATYRTPIEHNNPMEPHACTAWWDGDLLTVVDSSQGPARERAVLAGVFGLDESRVRIVAEHVGGGFGSKGTPRPQSVLAAMAARIVDRPVRVAVTRHQMFTMTGYRTPTVQRVRLGATPDGRLTAVAHEVVEQTSRLREFAEQTAVATRHMYAAPNRRTTHRLVRLDVPTPSWMRAPGECPGMFALESAMDELAARCGIDPVELRIRNEPDFDPESGLPFSSRNLVRCLREGAVQFGWSGGDPTPAARRDGRRLVGTGVAASTYPARARESQAHARAEPDGRFTFSVAAADIGTGARTALQLVAAEHLGVERERVEVRVGDTEFGYAQLAGGSMGNASWSWAVVRACEELRRRIDDGYGGRIPPEGVAVRVDTKPEIDAMSDVERHSFGAQFAEVAVDVDTGETRVLRLLGVFAAGRIVNALTARSQLVGGMTMGLSMALHEETVVDEEYGDFTNADLAGYHIASCADVLDVDATWIAEEEGTLGPVGAKGIGEIGIVGTAAAIANAVHHATGIRVRDLPILPEKLLG